MLDAILPYMRCPRCTGTPLCNRGSALWCSSCGSIFAVRNGIVDLIGTDPGEVITPFQRIMQTRLVASIYESAWRRAGYYLASSRSFSRETETVLQHQRKADDSRVLDLACGPGVFTRPIARRSAGLVVGLDLSWPMLRHAQRLIRGEGLKNIVLIRGSAFHLPFIAASFTYVNCCGALHLFDKPDDALKEIGRVLRAQGLLCVQTTIRPDRSVGLAFFLERFIRFGFFGEAGLIEKMSCHGFNILESERHRISFTFLARLER
ncbi:MAG TPA: class I SAM-dependent methyltransferase [Acidobacteriota bacterium]|nr:class I SAM-dependent methyltransferase [Acidobacteriota bacterium]